MKQGEIKSLNLAPIRSLLMTAVQRHGAGREMKCFWLFCFYTLAYLMLIILIIIIHPFFHPIH